MRGIRPLVLLSLVVSVSVAPAHAGSLAAPIMEPEVMAPEEVEAAAAAAGAAASGWVVPLIVIAAIAAVAAASGGSSPTPVPTPGGPSFE